MSKVKMKTANSYKIAVLDPCPHWRKNIPALPHKARRFAKAAVAAALAEGISVELNLVFADDRLMRDLNRKFRGKDKPTNVLSFPQMSPRELKKSLRQLKSTLVLGDVVMGYQTVRREAKEQGKALLDHMAHLTVHGVLHLFGHDHYNAAASRRMERLEKRVLAGFGISDPYLLYIRS